MAYIVRDVQGIDEILEDEISKSPQELRPVNTSFRLWPRPSRPYLKRPEVCQMADIQGGILQTFPEVQIPGTEKIHPTFQRSLSVFYSEAEVIGFPFGSAPINEGGLNG